MKINKPAFYTSFISTRLNGRLVDSKSGDTIRENTTVDLVFRNQYPRFVITHNHDKNKTYFDNTKTFQMSSEILNTVINILDRLIHKGSPSSVEVKYPNFKDGTPDGIITIGHVKGEVYDGVKSLIFTFEDYVAIFPLISTDKYMTKESTEEEAVKEFGEWYIELLRYIGLHYPVEVTGRLTGAFGVEGAKGMKNG